MKFLGIFIEISASVLAFSFIFLFLNGSCIKTEHETALKGLGLGLLFKIAHKFTSLNCHKLQKSFGRKEITIILKQCLQYLYL